MDSEYASYGWRGPMAVTASTAPAAWNDCRQKGLTDHAQAFQKFTF